MAGYTLKINEVVLDILMNTNSNVLVIKKLHKYGQIYFSVLAAFLFTSVWIFCIFFCIYYF